MKFHNFGEGSDPGGHVILPEFGEISTLSRGVTPAVRCLHELRAIENQYIVVDV